jgi:hypothetical protein
MKKKIDKQKFPQKFSFYLHDDETNMLEYLENKGMIFSNEAIQQLAESHPFYEVTLQCEVDAKGNITLLNAKL